MKLAHLGEIHAHAQRRVLEHGDDIARRNVALNGRDDRITIVEGDYRRIREWAASGAFAAVYANPPYREKSRGAYSDVDGIRRACHE